MSEGDVRAEHAWFFATGLPSFADFRDLPATAVLDEGEGEPQSNPIHDMQEELFSPGQSVSFSS
jgi:hypothetical protein